MATIYHGTPLTPRAALLDVCAGRAMCVSFYRPDDVEAVEAISPAIMFRQRRVLVLEAGYEVRSGMGSGSGLDTVLRMAGAAPVSSGAVGGHPRYAGSAFPAQRPAIGSMAVRTTRCAPMAYGRADRAAAATLRQVRPGMPWLDRRGQGYRLPSLSGANGRGFAGARQSLACSSHDARNGGDVRLPLCQRGQHFTCTEWMAL